MWDVQHDVEVLKRKHIDDLSPVADRVDASILRYQMPGLMLEDVHRQLAERNAVGRLAEVLEEANRVRQELGYPPLVAPIRQMIATQAVYNVIGGDRYATVTQELKDYLQGLYGRPPVPADPELRRLVLGREEPITIRPADLLEPQVEAARKQLKKMGYEPTDESVLIHLLFPNLAPDYLRGPEPEATEAPRLRPRSRPSRVAAAPDPPVAAPAAAARRRRRRGVRRRGRRRGLQGARQRRRHDRHARRRRRRAPRPPPQPPRRRALARARSSHRCRASSSSCR